MSNYPSLRLVALLLASATAPMGSFVAAASPPNSSASLTSQPLLDPDILSMLDQVDANRISADIQTLVSFGTRNTCSDNSGASPGIGAARDWIQNRYLSLPGLQVTLVPWTMGGCGGTTRTLHNVIAWIPGSGHPNRLIVIGGHYDSRTTNGLDGVSPAPGANDSGSQTALVLEAARVMAGHVFDATVVFADWSGEEQGLQRLGLFCAALSELFSKRHAGIELQLRLDRGRQHRKQRDDSSTIQPIFPRHTSRACDPRQADRLMIHHPPGGLCATSATGAVLMCRQ